MKEIQQENPAGLFKILSIARVCHEANRAWCVANGDMSQVGWKNAPEWQKKSTIEGVRFRLENPNAPASTQHEQWMQSKIDDGWVYGPVKNAEEKTHPCLVPYDELPFVDKAKDALFVSIVKTLSNA
jgi:hypothetical protein